MVAVALFALLAACGRPQPVLRPPDRYDSYCAKSRMVRTTGIQSTLTSTDDTLASGPVPANGAIRRILAGATGAIGYWNADQPLYLPRTAKALGYPGPYVNLVSAAVPNGASGETRPIYVTVRLPSGGTTTVTLRAFDVTDVCVEGTRAP